MDDSAKNEASATPEKKFNRFRPDDAGPSYERDSDLRLNRKEAERFLEALDPGVEEFTFQTFDDNKERKDENRKNKKLKGYDPLAKVFHGSLADYWGALRDYNLERAGIFITVNETDLKGRKEANVKRVRALFVDLDGSPLEPVLTDKDLPGPHITTETSAGRWHCYWLIDGMRLDDFTRAQKTLISHYNSDPSINDLPRVMRLPGFLHQKGEPYLVRIDTLNQGLPYKADEFLDALAKVAPAAEPKREAPQQKQETETQRLNTLALQNLSAWVPKLFPDAVEYNGGYRVSSDSLGRDLEEDLGLMPDGIKDFGLRDQPGEVREGKRTPIDIVIEFGKKDFVTACRWLREQLGLPQDGEGVSLNDFYAYMPMHNYIYAPSGEPWPGSSVNARLGVVPIYGADGKPVLEKSKQKTLPASMWLDQNKPVEQMTWAPGMPALIRGRLVSEGGWIERKGVSCFNLYRPPTIKPGDAQKALPWLEHTYRVFNQDDADHILCWCAHRVQYPQDKINHALVLGSKDQGIGKDTMLEPVKYAIGPWNFKEASPQQVLGRFNGFLKSIILRVNEARDLGDVDRYAFYDHTKAYNAVPPDALRVDEKHLREHYIVNCCGLIISTNHKTNGIYLPPEDRRHYVAWSDRVKADFSKHYWNDIWDWYRDGGLAHVAAFLAEYDLTGFDPKAPPPKTQAWHDIVDANRAPEDAELADIIDKLAGKDDTRLGISDQPIVITLAQIMQEAGSSFAEWLGDRKNRRAIPHRFENCGYVPVRNTAAEDGLWKIGGKRQVVYGNNACSIQERLKAARDLT